MTRLSFYGAAETVTGSKYLLEADGARVLVDCGLFQGLKELRAKNWDPLPLAAGNVDSVVLTHAHIDHTGYLPRFVKLGFQGPVYCTPPTRDLMEIMLLDSAKNQEEDADYFNRKRLSRHAPALPLYNTADVAPALKLTALQSREQWFQAAGPIWCRYHDVGHLLGASLIEVEVRSGAKPLRIVFSGDIGRYDAPLYHDPSPPPACDYLVCESTYGNREHPDEKVLDQLAGLMQAAIARGGVVVVAAFAVGRAQQLIYLLSLLTRQGRMPTLPVFLDSPMAVSATQIFASYPEEIDLSQSKLPNATTGFEAANLHLAHSVDDSKQINHVQGPAVIIASSGMMTGGRILHHLQQRLPVEKNTILLGGYMAEGTRGRALQDGARWLRIFGRDVPVRAAVHEMSSLSGHAGHHELLRWLEPLSPPRGMFVTHGEKASALALAEELRRTRGWPTHVPRLGESIDLETPS
ncbi:MAG TPA: MBL fold metallo-hydrolase [Pirellulales bacterium]|nr:MBL fold metallo-hydrolase [Pirellulales bacterium]